MANLNPNEKLAKPHDLGGNPAFKDERICKDDEQEPDDFGARVDALRLVLGSKSILLTDELRRGVEAIPKKEYFEMQYYERWLRSITAILLEKSVIQPEDLA